MKRLLKFAFVLIICASLILLVCAGHNCRGEGCPVCEAQRLCSLAAPVLLAFLCVRKPAKAAWVFPDRCCDSGTLFSLKTLLLD